MQRFHRFRTTALPTFREIDSPSPSYRQAIGQRLDYQHMIRSVPATGMDAIKITLLNQSNRFWKTLIGFAHLGLPIQVVAQRWIVPTGAELIEQLFVRRGNFFRQFDLQLDQDITISGLGFDAHPFESQRFTAGRSFRHRNGYRAVRRRDIDFCAQRWLL